MKISAKRCTKNSLVSFLIFDGTGLMYIVLRLADVSDLGKIVQDNNKQA